MLSLTGLRALKIVTQDNRLFRLEDVVLDFSGFSVEDFLVRPGGPLSSRVLPGKCVYIPVDAIEVVSFAEKKILASVSSLDLKRQEARWLTQASKKTTCLAKELLSFEVWTAEKIIGRITDLLFDISHWHLSYLTIFTNLGFSGKEVMCPLSWVKDSFVGEKLIIENLEEMELAPLYISGNPVNQVMERRQYDFNGKLVRAEVEQIASAQSPICQSWLDYEGGQRKRVVS